MQQSVWSGRIYSKSGVNIFQVRGEYILQSVSCVRGAYIAHSDLMGSQLTKVSVSSSRLGTLCQGPDSCIPPQLHISIFPFRLVSYLCQIFPLYFLFLNLQSCTDGLGSLPSVSACMGDKLSKVAGICLTSKNLFI